MWVRLVSLSVFAAVMIGAFIYFQWDKHDSVPAAQNQPSESAAAEEQQLAYDDWWSEEDERLISRPTYDRPVSVVHIGELNTDVLLGKRFGNVGESIANIDAANKTIHFNSGNQVPQADDRVLVVRDSNNMEVLLQEQLYRSSGDTVEVFFEPFQEPGAEDADYYLVNEARLFGGQSMTIRETDEEGTIEVAFQDRQQTVPAGQTAVFEESADLQGLQVRSKIVVTNYGLWDTSDMTYVVQE
ncbi:hypothetical protein COLU111180_07305 [Cohnella lubricantis]|uniref:Uncharacterized protein n=1 Tax=Cohnella lubricantis TaxID=2163172 RepID=A0A841TAN6_9BACL|nr:hypothetical protein [Cohnella lubricantis]MBB6678543.1 hypothetical protein [Cohnella lubricantis]MBP2119148.1 hypothetical protein [Cohnella lubricantis]